MGFLNTTIFNSHENSLFNVYMLPQSSNTFNLILFHSILYSTATEKRTPLVHTFITCISIYPFIHLSSTHLDLFTDYLTHYNPINQY